MTQQEAIDRAKPQAAELKRPLYVVEYSGSVRSLHGQFCIRRSVCVAIGNPYVVVHPDGRAIEGIREW